MFPPKRRYQPTKPHGISDHRNILLNCPETSAWENEFMCETGVNTSEEFTSRTANCGFNTQVGKLGQYHEKATGKWKAKKKCRKKNVHGSVNEVEQWYVRHN